MKYIKLSNGIQMPILGFGVFQVSDIEAENVVSEALKVGYRLIDTAAAYQNEAGVGRAIKKSGIPRQELFITTKLWIQDVSYKKAKLAFNKSLEKLGLEYIDLYLIHQPYNDYYGAWRAMEELYNEGKIRAIGVSNFDGGRLVDLIQNNKISPMVNQIEIHPFFQQKEEIAVMDKFNVRSEAWAPFAEGKNNIFSNEILAKIANKHKKTVAQVILRWHIQNNVIAIPKSVKKERIKENFAIFDFELTTEEMDKIAKLDTNKGLFAEVSQVDRAIQLNNYKF